MLGVGANHAHDTFAMHDFTVVTNFLNRCPYFHFPCPLSPQRADRKHSISDAFRFMSTILPSQQTANTSTGFEYLPNTAELRLTHRPLIPPKPPIDSMFPALRCSVSERRDLLPLSLLYVRHGRLANRLASQPSNRLLRFSSDAYPY